MTRSSRPLVKSWEGRNRALRSTGIRVRQWTPLRENLSQKEVSKGIEDGPFPKSL